MITELNKYNNIINDVIVESRKIGLEDGEFEQLLKTNCTWYSKDKPKLYRWYNDNGNLDYTKFKITPENYSRYRINPSSFFIQNSLAFKDYPKRLNSLVLSFREPSLEYAEYLNYPLLYEVIPYDNVKIAISSVIDINLDCDKSNPLYKYFGVLNLYDIFDYLDLNISDLISNNYDSYDTYIKVLDTISEKLNVEINKPESDVHTFRYKEFLNFYKKVLNNGAISFKDYFIEHFTPEKLDYKLIDISQIDNINKFIYSGCEVWTSGTCLLKISE